MSRMLLLLVLVTACGEAPTTTRAKKAEPSRSTRKPAKTLVKATPSKPPGPLPSGPGPLPASDDPQVRRSAVLAVLAGGSAATTLPERAADPDHPFDADLATALAPTAEGQVPRLRQGELSVKGELSEDVVRRLVRSNLGQLRSCYVQQLERDPSAAGTLELVFTVGPDGELTASSASSKTFDALMSTCAQGHLKRWRFPAPEDGAPVEVNYALVLSPR